MSPLLAAYYLMTTHFYRGGRGVVVDAVVTVEWFFL